MDLLLFSPLNLLVLLYTENASLSIEFVLQEHYRLFREEDKQVGGPEVVECARLGQLV